MGEETEIHSFVVSSNSIFYDDDLSAISLTTSEYMSLYLEHVPQST